MTLVIQALSIPKTFLNIWDQGSIRDFIPLHSDMDEEALVCLSLLLSEKI